MKNNIFGYLFVVFIIVIMGFAIYRVKIQNGEIGYSKLWQKTKDLSLNEIKFLDGSKFVGNDNIEHNYIQGRYGAIPYL